MKRKIIVTGGAGYIGSHTVVDLFNNGYSPVIIDNLCNSSEKNIIGINKILDTKIKWYNVDCTNYKLLKEIFDEETDIYGCIHFAAYKSVEESILFPKKYLDNNINSLKVLLKCMEENQIKNIIFSSSCTVYGFPDFLPVTENAPFKKAESPYGESKQICEKILSSNDCTSISLRYFNPIGSHFSNLIGDCSADKASNLVPIIVDTALGLKDILIVNGNNYSTHDGTCVRDYIHVEDLASAHVKAFDYLLEKKNNYNAFNIGTGKGLSILDIINSFEKVNNVKINYKIGPRRKGDVEAIYSNDELTKKELNWSPKKTLEEALKSAFEWKKSNR